MNLQAIWRSLLSVDELLNIFVCNKKATTVFMLKMFGATLQNSVALMKRRPVYVTCVCVCVCVCVCGPGSSVGIATDYGLDGPGSNPGGDEIFRPSRPALGPT